MTRPRLMIVALMLLALGIELSAIALSIHAGDFVVALGVNVVLIGLGLLYFQRQDIIRKQRERAALLGLVTNSDVFGNVIADNFDGLLIIDESRIVLAASGTAVKLVSSPSGVIGRPVEQLLPADIASAVERVFEQRVPGEASPITSTILPPSAAGAEYHIQYVANLSSVPTKDGGDPQLVVCLTFWDVTERRRKEERLSYLATHDSLTGALSRSKLVGTVDELLSSSAGRRNGVYLFMVDLSRFKSVNDTLGHSTGDQLLKQAFGRLKTCGVSFVARLGADCFALAHPGPISRHEIEKLCNGMIARLVEPYELGDHRAVIGVAVGVSSSIVSGFESETLLSHADMALSVAQETPGNSWVMFSPEMDERLKRKQDMEIALRHALERGELSILYQPQVNLETTQLIGVEALIRWNHPSLGAVPPDRFIPIAEETGLIVALGRFVLETACRDVASWPGELRLAVNVSPIQFELVDVVDEVRTALDKAQMPPDRLEVEITEGIFMSNNRGVTETLGALRRAGVSIALDDFGTGYSSLSYLGRLPVDKIKIDQSFVSSLPGDAEAGAIIRAVMTLSETLNKVVVAEGIETADQAWMLRIMGCRVGQGFHFGRPRSSAEMLELLGESGKPLRHADIA